MRWEHVVERHMIELTPDDKNWSSPLGEHAPTVDRLTTPVFTIDADAVASNLASMRDWVAERGMLIAPHGKTTMCPALWDWQLAEGAWGITVANEFQLRIALRNGVPRVIVANELLSPHGLRWLADELDARADLDVVCWVDSVEAVEIMTSVLTAHGASRPLGVCVEMGALAARTGARGREAALLVADAVVASPSLALRGVSGYEGSVPGADEAARLTAIRGFLDALRELFAELAPRFETDAPILTAGGSAYFDLVADAFAPALAEVPGAAIVLRSGAYIVHDDGIYRSGTPAATRTGPAFTAAAHVWARVLSTPEPGLALLDVGKRDVSTDSGLPEIQGVLRVADGVVELAPPPVATVVATNDQHSYVSVTPGGLRVGDVVRLGMSHPCTFFDKWRSALLTTGEVPVVRAAVPTFF